MAKIQYDRLDVLNEATNLFWKSGYYATSMQELFEVTGLKAGSVYLAFGNKESLFKMAIEHYTDTSLASLSEQFNDSNLVGKNICIVLQTFVEESYKSDYCGCFLVKSQLELGADRALNVYISDQLSRIETFYVEQLLSLYTKEEAKEKAASIMIHMFGLCVYGYQSKNQEVLLNTLQQSLPWLPWHTQH